MADYYTNFSAVLKLSNEREKKWCEDRFKKWEEIENEDSGCIGPDFQYVIKDDSLWMYTEESGNVDEVAGFVQIFLREFHPTGYWCMEWSNTCNKLRSDGFGGGAVFVTAEVISSLNSYQWLESQIEQVKKGNSLNGG